MARKQKKEDMKESEETDSDDYESGSEMSEEEVEVDTRTKEEIALEHKNKGNEYYKKELYHRAVDCYTDAIETTPDAPTYWNNRAAAYVMLHKYESAASDAKQATKLDPKFLKGYVRAAKAYLTIGKTSEALEQYNTLLLHDPRNSVAMEGKKLVDLSAKRKQRGLELLKAKEYARSGQMISLAMKEMGYDSDLRIAQVEVQMKQGNLDVAMELSTSLIKAGVGGTKLLHLRSQIYYFQGNFPAAIKHLKQLLSGDPDNDECAKDIKKIRKLEKKKLEGNDFFKTGQWEQAYTSYTECLEFDPENKLFCSKLLCNRAAVLNKLRRFPEAVADCDKAIEFDPSYTKAYMRRAANNLLINEIENIELAIRDYEQAKRLMGEVADTRDIDKSIREAKAALKQAKRKDYYKILGCPRDADEKAVKKAYRKASLKWHPDKWMSAGEDDAKNAERMFKEIGEAYAVLSDPEKKARYDSGVDIEDLDNPYAGHGHGHGGMGGMRQEDIFNMFFASGMGGMGGGRRGGGGFPGGFSF